MASDGTRFNFDEEPERSVELHPADFFTCEDCGRDTFVRRIKLTREEVNEMMQEIEDEHIAQGFSGVEWCRSPDIVECDHCRAEFRSAPPDPPEPF